MRCRTPSSWSGCPASLLLLLGFGACVAPVETDSAGAPVADPVAAVDVFVGTGGPGFRVGSSTPAAGLPFGLVKVGPDTSLDGFVFGAYHCSGYYWDDDTIEGFSHLHLHGVGVPDYGAILMMPTDGWSDTMTGSDGLRTPFSHAEEAAGPGWYRVTMANGVQVELGATPRTALHRYTWPRGTTPTVVFDLEHVLDGTNLGGEVRVDAAAGVVEGFMVDAGSFTAGYGGFPVYFRAEVEGGFTGFGTWGDGPPTAGATTAAGVDLGAWVQPARNPAVIRVGISLVDLDGARANLVEQGGAGLETLRSRAEREWAALLDPFVIEGADPDAATIFYTSLYHLAQMPTLQTDVDGRYRGFDHTIHRAEGWEFYSDMSMWDTYRTAHPAYNLWFPDHARDFARSLLVMDEQGGAFPRWPAASGEGGSMLGQPAAIVLADTWLRGVEGWDADRALERLAAQSRGQGSYPYNTPPDPSLLDRYGYYPSDLVGGSVAWTQELGWADDALANLAIARGRPDLAAWFEHRSYGFLGQWDAETGFFRGRRSDGSFEPGFDELAWEEDYTEGNAWQYLWMPPAHAMATAALIGGEAPSADHPPSEAALAAARARLETFFAEADQEGLVAGPAAYYWHGNEPDIHAAFLFGQWGDLDATARWQRWVEDERYFAAPDGLAGNDDAGTLSAWYLFSTLGLYPLAGSDLLWLGAPRFDRAVVPMAGGSLTIRREGTGSHLAEVWLDGVRLLRPWLHGGDLRAGSELVYVFTQPD